MLKLLKGDFIHLNSQMFNFVGPFKELAGLIWKVTKSSEDDEMGMTRLVAVNGLGVLEGYEAYMDKEMSFFRSERKLQRGMASAINLPIESFFNAHVELFSYIYESIDNIERIAFEAEVFVKHKSYTYEIVTDDDLQDFGSYPIDSPLRGLVRVYHDGINFRTVIKN